MAKNLPMELQFGGRQFKAGVEEVLFTPFGDMDFIRLQRDRPYRITGLEQEGDVLLIYTQDGIYEAHGVYGEGPMEWDNVSILCREILD